MHAFRTTGRSRALTLSAAALTAALAFPAGPAFADELVVTPVASTITGVSPTNGTVAGGSVVTITGRAFTGVTAVAFGRTPASRFDVVSDSVIRVVTPALAAGTHRLSVTTAAGTTTAGTITVRTFEQEVLRLVNEARAHKRTCGSKTYKAAKPLRPNAKLASVSAAHSADMAARSYFSHTSRNGDSPFDRMKDAGYRYRYAGENIAAGFRSPASVVQAWLKSPGHCKNIMKKKYTQLGVGYATGGYYGTYWTQDFGRPR